MTEIKTPDTLIEELGNAYKDYQIEIKELIVLAYLSGYNDCANSQCRTPATQAVLDAFRSSHTVPDCLAAALRAAADQVVPPALEDEFHDRNQALALKKMAEIRQKLNAIANELEAQ